METISKYLNSTGVSFTCYSNITPGQNLNHSLAGGLQSFSEDYKHAFGHVAVTICVISVVSNILNIIVLTRKDMSSAVHTFLSGIAVLDGLKVTLCIPWVLLTYIIHGTTTSPDRDTIFFARYTLFWAVTSTIIHSTSVWLTVTLAVFRYLCVHHPSVRSKYGNVKTARIVIAIVTVLSIIVCIPNSILYEVKSIPVSRHSFICNVSEVSLWGIGKRNPDYIKKINFWVQAIFVRILPCFLLMIFTILLVKTLLHANETRSSMTLNTSVSIRTKRTTKMLLSVLVLFLITETPHGILIILSSLIQDFFNNVYIPLGDVIDTLALVNNGINFVLYCTMSKQFRRKFIFMFCRCFTQHNGIGKPKLLKKRVLCETDFP